MARSIFSFFTIDSRTTGTYTHTFIVFPLVGRFAKEPSPQGHNQDSQIESDGPVLDVVKVMFNSFLYGCITSKAIDLS